MSPVLPLSVAIRKSTLCQPNFLRQSEYDIVRNCSRRFRLRWTVLGGMPSFLAKSFEECLPSGVSSIFNNFLSTVVKFGLPFMPSPIYDNTYYINLAIIA